MKDSNCKGHKAIKTAIIISVVIILVCGALYGVGNHYFSNIPSGEEYWNYEESWDIDLPAGMQQVFSTKTPASFHGDGLSYSIFQVDAVSLEWSYAENSEIEAEFTSILEKLRVSAEYMPDLSSGYAWNKMTKNDGTDVIYFIYLPSESRLYIAQKIS